MKIDFINAIGCTHLVDELFDSVDDKFCKYLGFDDISQSKIEVTSSDDRHKYWFVFVDGNLVGIAYIYDYKPKYKKCSIGYGLLPAYRGKNYSVRVIERFCYMLVMSFGMNRIQADVELDNTDCLHLMKELRSMGFNIECTAKSYWGEGVDCNIYSKVIN